jgi:glutathione S-transferase
MDPYTLVIGNQETSSWSLRPWLLLKQSGLPFQTVKVDLNHEGADSEILKHSPSGKVPVLIHNKLKIWESLAIFEYLAEAHPGLHLWPKNAGVRAYARSVSSEMHAGFLELRKNMPMHCATHLPGKGRTPAVEEDIYRIIAIWNDCRSLHEKDGKFLFGEFTIADAMFAPVVTRFATYDVHVDPVSRAYMENILSLPAMKEWMTAAAAEIRQKNT